jgi:aminopeptidase
MTERRSALDELEVAALHIVGGGTDLRLRLSPSARWQGGLLHTRGGQPFHPNVPSEELFTSPDHRCTAGVLVASRPLRLPDGTCIENLKLWFEQGTVVKFEAGTGREAFDRWLAMDCGARRLGEVALVGLDSPLAQCGLLFDHVLYDENAAAHVALGDGFPFALTEGNHLSSDELRAEGLNRSAVHIDIPFGSPRVDVHATLRSGRSVPLLWRGQWHLCP